MYKHFTIIVLQVGLYDKIKHAYLPLDKSKYTDFQYQYRYYASAAMIMGMTALFTYPLDLIHTRLATDMTPKGQNRNYITTFDCFNKTNIHEGKKGLYKGYELSIISSAIRSMICLPLYDAVKPYSKDLPYNLDKIGVSFMTSVLMSLIVYPLDTAKRCM